MSVELTNKGMLRVLECVSRVLPGLPITRKSGAAVFYTAGIK